MKDQPPNRFSFRISVAAALVFLILFFIFSGLGIYQLHGAILEGKERGFFGQGISSFFPVHENQGTASNKEADEKAHGSDIINDMHLAVFWILSGFICAIVSVFFAVAAFFWERYRLRMSLVEVSRGMQAIQQGDFSCRIHGAGMDGAEELLRAFDEMAATLERSDKARKTLLEIQIRHNTQWIREVRRRQKSLALHKQRLEEKVAARTHVLETINTALRSSVRSLERRTLEITQLNRLAEALQNAKDTSDAASLVVRTCQQIFPSDAGILALPGTQGRMEIIAGWGRDRPDIDHCMGEACPCKKSAADRVSVCGAGVDGCEELCIPVIPREGKGAMMRIRLRQMADLYGRKQAARRALAGSVAGHLTACLTSLHLVDRLRREAVTDPLTGLYNRRYMEETFVRELSRMKRENLPLSVILMDVDDFKLFNDTHGHDVGDLVLQNLAGVLKKDVRTEDVACRYGGEEFLLLLPGLSAEDGLTRAEALRKRVASSPLIIAENQKLGITISLGIACWPEDAPSPHELITAADKAMYMAKQAGRNRVCRATSGDSGAGV